MQEAVQDLQHSHTLTELHSRVQIHFHLQMPEGFLVNSVCHLHQRDPSQGQCLAKSIYHIDFRSIAPIRLVLHAPSD